MSSWLIVVDMQVDFVRGALGTKEAEVIIPALSEKVKNFSGKILFTRDTHKENYLQSQEGKYLPVPHCIQDTEGWEIIPELAMMAKNAEVLDKPNFGSLELADFLKSQGEPIESIELVGLCTDICVVSNGLILKATFSEIPIRVDSKCCAGVTPEKHRAALEVLKSCQVEVS